MQNAMEEINRLTWRRPLVLRDYKRGFGYLNAGEELVFKHMFEAAPSGSTLDIGVGAGRTTGLLSRNGCGYTGVDYTPEMIATARLAHPDKHFEVMDARDLSAFADASFDRAVFSYNGIDSVDGNGRLAVLREVYRVLKPGGVFVFSTFHRNWRGFDGNMGYSARIYWTSNPVTLALRTVRYAAGYVSASIRKRRFTSLQQKSGEHTLLLHSAHEFGILIYATTSAQIQAQLSDAGFLEPASIFTTDANPVSADISSDSISNEEYFHVMVRKPQIV
jgi:ubiquinone/menaquinone biosynthesis C-methylase UbiE